MPLSRCFSTSRHLTLSVGERVRSLVEMRKSGTLTSVSMYATKEADAPLFGSIMPYVTLDDGCPVFGLYKNERHQANLKEFNKASLVVHPLTPPNINPTNFAIPRANITGLVEQLEDAELFGVDKTFRNRHPGSSDVIDQFLWYRLKPSEIIFASDGYSVSKTISFKDYATANIDPVVVGSPALLKELNGQYLGNVARLCETHGGRGVDEVFVFGVDKFGFDAMGWAKNDDSWQAYRFSFSSKQKDIQQCEDTLKDLLCE